MLLKFTPRQSNKHGDTNVNEKYEIIGEVIESHKNYSYSLSVNKDLH